MFTNPTSKMFAALITLAVVLGTANFVTRSMSVPVADRSFDGIEQARALRPFAHNISASGYDQIEAVRVLRNSPNVNASYEALEQVRNARGLSADRSYDGLEQARTSRPFAFTVSASGYDMIEQLRLERELTADHSYDKIEALRLGR